VGLALGALLAAAACSSSGAAASSSGATAGRSGAAAPGVTATGTGAAPGSSAAVRTCSSSSLAVKIQSSDGAAGSVRYELALTDTGSVRCAVAGYPGVSLLDAAEHQLGAPADREPAGQPPGAAGASGGRIALAPGGVAVFTVVMTSPGVLPGCLTVGTIGKAFTMRVYPPDNTVPILVRFGSGTDGVDACADPAVHELKVTTVGAV
jgi:hypothetical protein